MYVAEAIPTVVVGILTLLVLTDRPAQANFLTTEEKDWLAAKLASERPPTKDAPKFGFAKVLVLTLMYVVITVASLGLLYYTQQISAWLNAHFGAVPPVVVVLIPYLFGPIEIGRAACRESG